MFVELPPQIHENLSMLLASAPVKGSDAGKVVLIHQILGKKDNAPYYEFDESLISFIIQTLQGVTIQGRSAALFLEVVIKLGKPLEKLPESKVPPSPPLPSVVSQKLLPPVIPQKQLSKPKTK